jgi:hypothetical protein
MAQLIDLAIQHWRAVSAAIATAALTGYVALRVGSKGRRAEACANFRAAVLAQFEGLYPNPVSWPEEGAGIDHKLRSVFPKLQTAVAAFRPYVPWYRRWLFDRAWFRYRCATGRPIDTQCYHHYMPFVDNPQYRENFKRNVASLLSYARET